MFENLFEYMSSLKKLRSVMSRDPKCVLNNIYPGKAAMAVMFYYCHIIDAGHGPVIRNGGIDKVDEYIKHREIREQQVLACLTESQGWMSSWMIMKTVYKQDIPKMPFIIQLSAQNSAVHHLEKLSTENRVERRWPDLWRIIPK